MTTPTATTTGSSRRLMRSMAVLGLALATMALSFSAAYFTDTDDVTAAQIATGTLDLTAPANVDFSLTNMAPGDESTRTVSLDNDASLELRYDMSTAATDSDATFPLSDQLDLTIYVESEEDAGETGAPNDTCDQDLAGAAGFTKLQDAVALSAGALTDRVIAASASDVLCFIVSLPGAETGNDYQGDTTDVTFTFPSEQTANNP